MHGSVLICILSFVALEAFGQNNPQQPAPAQVTTERTSFTKELKKTVGLLTVKYDKEGRSWKDEGTCFFIYYPDERIGKDQGFGYLVTNRHVAVPGIEDGHPYSVTSTTLRLNRKGSNTSDEKLIPLGGSLRWYFPEDAAVDLAILPFAPDQVNYDIKPLPVSMVITRQEIEPDGIAEGDPIVFAGYFYQFPGLQKFQPIVREGTLAMMPDEQLDTTLHKRGNLYLADVHVAGGNSGSPLLMNLGGFRNGGLNMNFQYKLLGVISGFYHEDSDFTLTIATTYRGTLQGNSGIATIVPAYFLKDLLNSPALQTARDAFIASR